MLPKLFRHLSSTEDSLTRRGNGPRKPQPPTEGQAPNRVPKEAVSGVRRSTPGCGRLQASLMTPPRAASERRIQAAASLTRSTGPEESIHAASSGSWARHFLNFAKLLVSRALAAV